MKANGMETQHNPIYLPELIQTEKKFTEIQASVDLSLIHISQKPEVFVQHVRKAAVLRVTAHGFGVCAVRVDAAHGRDAVRPVSYTHLDVYKRQAGGSCPPASP